MTLVAYPWVQGVRGERAAAPDRPDGVPAAPIAACSPAPHAAARRTRAGSVSERVLARGERERGQAGHL
ncbi:MAG: hypothetical protein ACLFTG_11230, partial [Alphaproteobacteria bacterium]